MAGFEVIFNLSWKGAGHVSWGQAIAHSEFAILRTFHYFFGNLYSPYLAKWRVAATMLACWYLPL